MNEEILELSGGQICDNADRQKYKESAMRSMDWCVSRNVIHISTLKSSTNVMNGVVQIMALRPSSPPSIDLREYVA